MKRWLKLLLPVVLLLLFVSIMTGDWYYKRPHSRRDDVTAHIAGLRTALLAEEKEAAQLAWQELDTAWRLVIRRVQFSVERDEINGLNVSLARVRGALQADDFASALIELAEVEEHWVNLGK